MKTFFKKIEDLLTATALAELGALETVRDADGNDGSEGKGIAATMEKYFTAVTFAEAGELDTAREFLEENGRHDRALAFRPDDCQYGDNDLCYSQA